MKVNFRVTCLSCQHETTIRFADQIKQDMNWWDGNLSNYIDYNSPFLIDGDFCQHCGQKFDSPTIRLIEHIADQISSLSTASNEIELEEISVSYQPVDRDRRRERTAER